MSRALHLVVPILAVTGLVVVAILIAPIGAVGGEYGHGSARGSDDYYFGRDATISAAAAGSVQVYGGSADVRQPIRGDLIVLGGNVVFRDGGRVGGNLIYAGGRVEGAEGRVGGRVHSLSTLQGAAATVARGAVVATLLLVWFVVAGVVALFGGREIRFSSVEVRASSLYCLTLGLVAFTSFVITAIVFSYLVPFVIGVPLLAFLAVFAILTKVYGMVAVFHAVGTIIAGSRTREQLDARRWFRGDLAMVVIGLVVLGAIRLIPVVGTIIWSGASLFGVGCALATRFGQREPAFLAWRPSRPEIDAFRGGLVSSGDAGTTAPTNAGGMTIRGKRVNQPATAVSGPHPVATVASLAWIHNTSAISRSSRTSITGRRRFRTVCWRGRAPSNSVTWASRCSTTWTSSARGASRSRRVP